jgi:hypothetical protein
MAIIICPTLTAFTEVDMLSSRGFKINNHEPVSIWIRNHNSQTVATLKNQFMLPKGIMKCNALKTYRERENIRCEIKVKIDNLNPNGGIEMLQRHLKNVHPDIDFYVLQLVTQTVVNGIRHNLLWKRKAASASNSNIVSLHLVEIDDQNTLENFSQGEMWKIAGTLPDDRCRLRTVVSERIDLVCDPVDN